MHYLTAPKISIIVAIFNGKNTLMQCIDSISQQTYLNKELIIIDGNSIDGTVDLLKKNRDKFSYWISEPDHGIYNAWNKGLVQARGDWICFLGVDDFFWDKNVLEKMVEKLEKVSSNVRIVYGQIMRLGSENQKLFLDGEPWQEARKRFNQFMTIPHPAVMHHKSLFDQHGKFDESFRIAGDYEFLLRELKNGDAKFIPDIIVTGVRYGGISTLPCNTMRSLKELYRAQRIHGQLLPRPLLLKAMTQEYLRILLWKLLGNQTTKKLINVRRRLKGRDST